MNKLLTTLAAFSASAFITHPLQAEDLNSFYASNRVIQVEINTSHWDRLRLADPVGGRCNFDFIGDRYSYETFEEVRVNGVSYGNVGAKKKSWCGSESKDKPSINLKFDKFDKDTGKAAKANMGTDALTLNNSIQDPSYLRQCLSYEAFRKAGIASPLCNFARLRVNGVDMGLYVNLQPLKKAFFKSNFPGELGNVYEFSGENFEWYFIPRLEANMDSLKETEDKSMSDFRGVIEALDSGDMGRIAQLVDIDQFLRYWAMEMAFSHSDGLTLGNNNAYVYFPENGKMQTVPWGTDRVLESGGQREARSLYATNRLANRLTQDPASYAKLMGYLKQYMNEWDSEAIIGQLNTTVNAVQNSVRDWERGSFYGAVEGLKNNIRNRPAEVASFAGNGIAQTVKIINSGFAWMCLNTQATGDWKVTNVWGCDEHQDQRWEISQLDGDWVRIRNPASGNCVNVLGSDEGQAVGAWTCDRHPDQTWKAINLDAGARMFESQRAPGKCLSIGRAENAADTVLKGCNRKDASQVWRTN